MYAYFDEDEWETVVEHRQCASCRGDMRKCRGGCNGMSGYGLKRRSVVEVMRIKAERRRKEEDDVLARADAIRARRAKT